MTTLYMIEQHDQLLHLWREQRAVGLRVDHLDFHCDLRGLLINRRTQQAYQINDQPPELDEGNFLTHAIMEGRVERLRWVHRLPGGRQYDVGTVKYETDLTGRWVSWLLALKDRPARPIHYEVMEFSAWPGLNQGEFLDIDWDFFASLEYPLNTVQAQVESFLGLDWPIAPQQISLCYSPDFSHPSRPEFESFAQRLAQKFGARLVRQPLPVQPVETPAGYKKYIPRSFYRWLRRGYYQTNLWLRQKGIY